MGRKLPGKESSLGSLVWQHARGCNPFDEYEVVNKLQNEGSSFNVDLVKRKSSNGGSSSDESMFALKYMKMGSTSSGADTMRLLRQIRNEISIYKLLDHPNIINVYEEYEYAKSPYIVMDHCTGGSIFQRRKYTEKKAAEVIGQLLSVVRYIHDRGVVHGQLLPQHIVFEDSSLDAEIRVNDFGFAFFEDSKHNKKPQGFSYYNAPETLSGNFTQKADMWSLGVIAHALLCGRLPFSSPVDYFQIMGGEQNVMLKFDSDLSTDAQSFIRSLLQTTPGERIDSHQAQRHPWMKTKYKEMDKQIDRIAVRAVARHIRDTMDESVFKKAARAVSCNAQEAL